MNRFKPRIDILPLAQQKLWPELQPATQLDFVLYRGTAIALRLGHRLSVDFDFFTEKPLNKQALQKNFSFMHHSKVIQDSLDTLTLLVPINADYIKVSFFGSLDFGRVAEPEETEDGVLQVAALDDLIAHKLKVILQRIEAKDYQDIAALLEADVSLEKGLAAARVLYGAQFQPSESLKAMVYFVGGDLHTLSQQVKETLAQAVSQVRELPKITVLSKKLGL